MTRERDHSQLESPVASLATRSGPRIQVLSYQCISWPVSSPRSVTGSAATACLGWADGLRSTVIARAKACGPFHSQPRSDSITGQLMDWQLMTWILCPERGPAIHSARSANRGTQSLAFRARAASTFNRAVQLRVHATSRVHASWWRLNGGIGATLGEGCADASSLSSCRSASSRSDGTGDSFALT
jgi:hypothetical protein